jgi:hypothetical protein
MHREPMWTQAQTGACNNGEPCPLGQADQGHFFQRDDNPWVDNREVFDAYGQVCQRSSARSRIDALQRGKLHLTAVDCG